MRRLVAWVGRFAATLLFRRVEVAGLERYPRDRPVLLVANHFNGFVDPVLIATALGPHCRASSPRPALRKIPIAGLAAPQRRGGVRAPARRRPGGDGRATRTPSSSATGRSPTRDVVAIFPEGTTHDRAQHRPDQDRRRPHRARRAGRGRRRTCAIVPGGPHVPRQGRAAVVGPRAVRPADRARRRGPGGVGRRRRRRRRASSPRVIDRGLRAVSPDFPDVETALALDQAAPGRAQQPRPTPTRRSRRGTTWPGGSGAADPERPGRGAPGRRPLPHHARRAPPHRRRRHRADQPRAPAPLRVLDRRARRAPRRRSSPPPRSINVWPAALVVLVEPAREDPGVEGHRARARRAGRVPDRVDHRGRAGRRRRCSAVTLVRAHRRRRARWPPIWMVERAHGPRRGCCCAGRRSASGSARSAWPTSVRADVVDTVRAVAGGRREPAPRHVAESDCEEIRPGLIGQPANTRQQPGASSPPRCPIARAARRRRPAGVDGGRGGDRRRGRRAAWPTTAPAGAGPKRLHDGGLVALAATLGVAVGREGRPCARRPADRRARHRRRRAARAQPHRGTALLVPQPAPGPRRVPRAGGGGARGRRRATLSAERASGRRRGAPRARRRRRPTRGRRSGRRSRSRRR